MLQCFTRGIIYFNPIFCSEVIWLIWRIIKQIFYLLMFIYYIILILVHQQFCGFFSGDIYLFLFCISLSRSMFSLSFVSISEVFCRNFPVKSLLASSVFWVALFEAVSSKSVPDYLAWSRSLLLYILLKFLLIFFTNIFTHIFNKRWKSLNPLTNTKPLVLTE